LGCLREVAGKGSGVKTVTLVLAFLGGLGAQAWGQDLPGSLAAEWMPPASEAPDGLPRSLVSESQIGPVGPTSSPMSMGPVGGYLAVRGADHGTWFGGLQTRIRFSLFAVEASITGHQSEFEHGDIRSTQFPVQVNGFFYPLTSGSVRPYLLAGVGWYYTRFQYRGSLSGVGDRTDHIYGYDLGGGFELMFGPTFSMSLDARYNVLNEKDDPFIHKDFNYWQVGAGLNFFF
jgi:hypothetical protein